MLEMPFTGIEKVFCVLEYAQTQLDKTVQYEFVRELIKNAPMTILIWT